MALVCFMSGWFFEKVFERVVEGRVVGCGRLCNDFVEVPFVVAEGVNFLYIEFEYDGAGCRLMLGLMDSTGSLRGWCSRCIDKRIRVFISRSSATPGHVPGDIVAGVWRAIVRLDSVSKDGCNYRLRVVGYNTALGDMEFDYLGDVLSKLAKVVNLQEFGLRYPEIFAVSEFAHSCSGNWFEERRTLHSHGGSGWYRGDLHMHTVHSDGRNTLCELLSLAVSRGLDFIVLTDHNTISQNTELVKMRGFCRGLLAIPGMEVTTFYGHVNALGIDKYIDFRRKSREDFEKLVDDIHSAGGIASINHPTIFREPFCRDCPFRYRDLRRFDAVEVWNGPWHLFNNESLSWWHTIVAEGYRVTAVGGSDYHGSNLARLGEPTTWVYAESLNPEGILRGIRMGRVFITHRPEGPIIEVKAIDNSGRVHTIGDEIAESVAKWIELEVSIEMAKKYTFRILTERNVHKIVDIDSNEFKHRERIDVRDAKLIRIEIGKYRNPHELIPQNSDDILALTNPIYITTEGFIL